MWNEVIYAFLHQNKLTVLPATADFIFNVFVPCLLIIVLVTEKPLPFLQRDDNKCNILSERATIDVDEVTLNHS